MSDYSKAGTSWTSEEDELLRIEWLAVIKKFDRTPNAVYARLKNLTDSNWQVGWPLHRPAPNAFQIMQDYQAAYDYLASQLSVGVPISMTNACLLLSPMGIPHHYGVATMQFLQKKGMLLIEPGTRKNTLTVTLLPRQPQKP